MRSSEDLLCVVMPALLLSRARSRSSTVLSFCLFVDNRAARPVDLASHRLKRSVVPCIGRTFSTHLNRHPPDVASQQSASQQAIHRLARESPLLGPRPVPSEPPARQLHLHFHLDLTAKRTSPSVPTLLSIFTRRDTLWLFATIPATRTPGSCSGVARKAAVSCRQLRETYAARTQSRHDLIFSVRLSPRAIFLCRIAPVISWTCRRLSHLSPYICPLLRTGGFSSTGCPAGEPPSIPLVDTRLHGTRATRLSLHWHRSPSPVVEHISRPRRRLCLC